MNPVNWFEIPAKDINESKAFYEYVFDIEMQVTEMGPLTMAWFPFDHEKPGCAGTLVEAESYNPSHDGSTVYFSVDDVAPVFQSDNKLHNWLSLCNRRRYADID
ncbi:MAG: hypothetical protein U5K00_24205 [Melioribacteraceae bacterium]|nr:hypothetical protein [Melioribacteraceae bacterium]